MALRRPLTKALSCNNCQQWILRSFISGIGGQPPPPVHPTRRAFASFPVRHNEARERMQQVAKEEEHPLNVINDDMSEEASQNAQSHSEDTLEQPAEGHVPWYLQVQQPALEEQTSPMSARQRIPDLPEHSPAILQPLLQHVSVELGMDDLSLLDLRLLDPPPALGANLLMIIGTARSEKHLHVSADRLCRWLRTEYKMRPYADGLLGRNELKLKLRRKAKRSKLMSAVGTKPTADTEVDDGIRTGWVCVNLGRVEGGELPKSEVELQKEAGIVGFGTEVEGSSIVVQMLTEEKRGDIDLENLWEETLRRARTKKEKMLEGLEREEHGSEEIARESATGDAPRQDDPTMYRPAAVSSSTAEQQTGAYRPMI